MKLLMNVALSTYCTFLYEIQVHWFEPGCDDIPDCLNHYFLQGQNCTGSDHLP